jgi:hypothetical protein
MNHNKTNVLVPMVNRAIPPGKFIYVDETFLIEELRRKNPNPKHLDTPFSKMGKELVPYGFNRPHLSGDFIKNSNDEIQRDFGRYIYNQITGFQ